MVRAHRRMPSINMPFLITLVGVLTGLLAVSLAGSPPVKSATLPLPSRSTTIALTSDETRLVVVNREANTVSIIRVKNAENNDVSVKLAGIGVGLEPRCVAVHPNDQVAYVTNGISATVSVVDLRRLAEFALRHGPEVYALTRTNRHVAAAWLRDAGPDLLDELLVAAGHPHQAPPPLDGSQVAERLDRRAGTLARHGSAALRADLHQLRIALDNLSLDRHPLG
jgi:hypothetical protein